MESGSISAAMQYSRIDASLYGHFSGDLVFLMEISHREAVLKKTRLSEEEMSSLAFGERRGSSVI